MEISHEGCLRNSQCESASPYQIRELYTYILLFAAPAKSFDEFWQHMADDFEYFKYYLSRNTNVEITQVILRAKTLMSIEERLPFEKGLSLHFNRYTTTFQLLESHLVTELRTT